MLAINHSVLVRPQILNTYLFSTPTQTQFSSSFYALCDITARCLLQFILNSSPPIVRNKAFYCRCACDLKKILAIGNERGVKSFLID